MFGSVVSQLTVTCFNSRMRIYALLFTRVRLAPVSVLTVELWLELLGAVLGLSSAVFSSLALASQLRLAHLSLLLARSTGDVGSLISTCCHIVLPCHPRQSDPHLLPVHCKISLRAVLLSGGSLTKVLV